jgi:hypothetical protein
MVKEEGEAMQGKDLLYYSRWRSVTSIDSFKFNAAKTAHSSKKIDSAVFLILLRQFLQILVAVVLEG